MPIASGLFTVNELGRAVGPKGYGSAPFSRILFVVRKSLRLQCEIRNPSYDRRDGMELMVDENSEHSPEDLQQIYRARFAQRAAYRQEVWAVLSRFFSQWIAPDSAVLDLGCGWCEFINSAACRLKLGMDLNPDARRYANPGVAI